MLPGGVEEISVESYKQTSADPCWTLAATSKTKESLLEAVEWKNVHSGVSACHWSLYTTSGLKE